MSMKLFDSDTDDSNDDVNAQLTINKSYAQNYEKWRSKEDYQALKDKYGDESESDDESSVGGLAEPDNPEFDMDFYRTLAAVNLQHPVLEKGHKFFQDSYEASSRETPNENKEKLTIQEHERNVLLKTDGKIEEMDVSKDRFKREDSPAFDSENTKPKFILDDDISDDGDPEDLFTKCKTDQAKEKSGATIKQNKPTVKNEALEFLQGKSTSLRDNLDKELLGGLKKHWNTQMSEKNKFLMDFFVNQKYLEEEDITVETDPHHCIFDFESVEEDEKTFDRLEQLETKYRFRFEEPDEEYIKTHPRIIPEVVRKRNTKRSSLREQKMTRYQEQLEREKQERLRLRAFKKQHILKKINILKKVSGIDDDSKFEGIDLAADFNPEEHDASMQKMFNENYYDDEYPNSDFPELQDDVKDALQQEYDELDDLKYSYEGTFKYVKVLPNDYGLSTEEILNATDDELKKWCSLKMMNVFGKSELRENSERDLYRNRSRTEGFKEMFFPSLYSEDPKSVIAREAEKKRARNLKKKERKNRKKNEAKNLNDQAPESVPGDEKSDLGLNEDEGVSFQEQLSQVDEGRRKREKKKRKLAKEQVESEFEVTKENEMIPKVEVLVPEATVVSSETVGNGNLANKSRKKRKRSLDSDQHALNNGDIGKKREGQAEESIPVGDKSDLGSNEEEGVSFQEQSSQVDEGRRKREKKKRKLAKEQVEFAVTKENEMVAQVEVLVPEAKEVSSETVGKVNLTNKSRKKRKHSLDLDQQTLNNGEIGDSKRPTSSKEERKKKKLELKKLQAQKIKEIKRKIRNKKRALAKRRAKAKNLNAQAKEFVSIDEKTDLASKGGSDQPNPSASNKKRKKKLYWIKESRKTPSKFSKFDPSLKWIDELSSKRMSAYGQENPDTSKFILHLKHKKMKDTGKKPSS